METVHYRRLVPAGPEIDARGYLQALELRGAAEGRPYVLVNFVTSVDGHSTVEGGSRKLSGPADRAMFYALRERVDGVLIGPGTLAAERYKRMLPAPERREWRLSRGLPAEPLAVTISRSGRVPRDIPLFRDAPDRVLVFEGADADLAQALSRLREQHGVETLLCEGGPMLFGALLRAGLVDELFLTLAPYIAGGASGPTVVSGPPAELPTSMQLAGALEHEGALFLRYRLTGQS